MWKVDQVCERSPLLRLGVSDSQRTSLQLEAVSDVILSRPRAASVLSGRALVRDWALCILFISLQVVANPPVGPSEEAFSLLLQLESGCLESGG